MPTSAKIICDSVSQNKKRITTMEISFPRFILPEFNTHRVFSRNTSSSRAIPIKKMVKMIKEDMFVPKYFGKNMPGMQATEEVSFFAKKASTLLWKLMGNASCNLALILDFLGVHKQLSNRLCENFGYVKVIVTSTEWDNFFELRDHEDAQPEIQELAKCIHKVLDESVPVKLKNDEWHLPYVTEEQKRTLSLLKQIQISVARCARVSYLTHDGNLSTFDKDIKLYERLVGSEPLHASPTEHQATSVLNKVDESYQGNFVGFVQFRKVLEEKNSGKNSKRVSEVFSHK